MSALDFWRMAYSADKSPSPGDCSTPDLPLLCTEEDAWTYAPPHITPELLRPEQGVLHITVQDAGSRYRSSTHRCHQWSGAFPDASFYRLSDNALVASPQFAFLQMARDLSLIQLVALGYELCGSYSFDHRSDTGMRQRRVPLVALKELAGYLDRISGRVAAGLEPAPPGLRKAQRALGHVLERSASPIETEVAMLLSLPRRLGGYGIRRPDLNYGIALTGEAARIARRRTLRADLCWPDRRIDLEFDGRVAHAGRDAALSDRARTNALMLMDYTVVEITSQQLADWRAFESIALYIAKALGVRIERKGRGPLPRRMQLRECLTDWNRAQGRA